MRRQTHRRDHQRVAADARRGRPLLEHHEVPLAAVDLRDGVGGPVGVVDDGEVGPGCHPDPHAVARRFRHLRHDGGKVVDGGQAVADEEDRDIGAIFTGRCLRACGEAGEPQRGKEPG